MIPMDSNWSSECLEERGGYRKQQVKKMREFKHMCALRVLRQYTGGDGYDLVAKNIMVYI